MVGFTSGASIPASWLEPQPKTRRALPFASISASITSTLGAPGSSASSRKETNTGLEFPYQFCLNQKANCPSLAGLGVRAKRILGLKNLNIYALGIYVDDAAAKKLLTGSKFRGLDLATSQAVFDDLISSDSVEKTLRLVISYGHLRRAQFLDALEERLAPPLKQANETAALEAFKAQFDKVEFSKGLEITFTQKGKELVTKVGGKPAGVLTSQALSRALWDIYLGPDPVSKDAKESLGLSLAAVAKL